MEIPYLDPATVNLSVKSTEALLSISPPAGTLTGSDLRIEGGPGGGFTFEASASGWSPSIQIREEVHTGYEWPGAGRFFPMRRTALSADKRPAPIRPAQVVPWDFAQSPISQSWRKSSMRFRAMCRSLECAQAWISLMKRMASARDQVDGFEKRASPTGLRRPENTKQNQGDRPNMAPSAG